MGLVTRLFAYFQATLPAPVRVYPFGYELVAFDARGCMATDWRETDRGVVIDRIYKPCHGSANPLPYLLVERRDGTTFDCFEHYCHPGEPHMAAWTDNPDESLVGKVVFSN